MSCKGLLLTTGGL